MAQQQQFQAATLAPDILARQLRLQRDSQMAQSMLEQAAQPLQGQMISGHYVAPSWTQHANRALQQFIGMRAADKLPEQQLELQREQNADMLRRFGLGPQQAAPQGSQAQGPTAQAFPVGESGQQMPQQAPQQAPQQQQQSMYPLLPGRSQQESFMTAQAIGLPAYFKLVAEQSNQKPVSVAPGGSLVDPRTGQVTYTAPQNGIQIINTPNGPQAVPVRGYGEANARNAALETAGNEAARAGFDLIDVPDGRGGSIKMPRAQAIQALGQQGMQGGQGGQAQGQTQSGQAQGELGRTLSPQVQAARAEFPKIESQVNQIVSVIDQALNHPGKKWALGLGSLAPTFPNTDQANFRALQKQLEGQVFLQAYDALKGGGVITDIEGAKAEQALARLSTAQTVEAYDKALNELKELTQTALTRARTRAEMPAPQATAKPNFDGGDYSSLWGN